MTRPLSRRLLTRPLRRLPISIYVDPSLTMTPVSSPSLKGVTIIAAPFHAGAYCERVGKGPHRIVETGLLDALHSSGIKDVVCVELDRVDAFEGEIGRTFEVKRRIALAVAEAVSADRFPLVLAGNCNATIGVYAGLSQDCDVVWFDAHPDFNTPEEVTGGYFDGMGVATLAGHCWTRMAYSIPKFRPLSLNRLIYCGTREFDKGQREKLETYNIRTAFGDDDSSTLAHRLDKLLDDQYRHGPALVHIDLDVLSSDLGRANEYAVEGGPDEMQLYACLKAVVAKRRPIAMTIASFNPDMPGSAAIADIAVKAACLTAQAAFLK